MTALKLHRELHRNGTLTQHVATVDGFRIEASQHEQAARRANGTWFITIGVDGHPLRCESQHRTLADAHAFTTAVLDAVTGLTHAELLAAIELVEAGDTAAEDQDAAPIVVIPCGAQKLDEPAPAGELYTSQHFQLVLRAARRVAEEQAGRVLILSARHGLVDPDAVLAPYDVKMGDPETITPAAIAGQLRAIRPTTITTLLPRAYGQALDEAAELAGAGDLIDLYADAPGIGYQRGVAARILAA